METVGAICEGEWNSALNGIICSEDQADFMSQLLGNYYCYNNEMSASSIFWDAAHDHQNMNNVAAGSYVVGESSSMYSSSSSDAANSSIYNNPFPSSLLSGHHEGYYPSSTHRQYFATNYPSTNLMTTTMDYCTNKNMNNVILEGDDDFLLIQQEDVSNDNSTMDQCNDQINRSEDDDHDDVVQTKNLQQMELSKTLKLEEPMEISKKRPRVPLPEVQRRSKKIMKLNKCEKVDDNDDKDNNNINNKKKKKNKLQRQSSSSCCSEDDDDDDAERVVVITDQTSSGILNSNGKTRAGRGSATDPQSLYARKRRERINERLKILQNLVPNGTKVDISTMLEEAVQYVKFLQLQIKLLSSDDLWMYSPIAYNGMDIGLDWKTISTPKSQS